MIWEKEFDLDRFFYPGYVIELEKDVYYRGCKNGKALYGAAAYAERFISEEEAEKFIHRHLRSMGRKAYICEVCWVLLSVDSETEDAEQYWDGRQFTEDPGKAITFFSYRELLSCQRKEKLQEVSMIDLRTFRRKQVLMAA